MNEKEAMKVKVHIENNGSKNEDKNILATQHQGKEKENP